VVSKPQWLTVDEGWGRRAAEFASLIEPANCREYVALHQLLGVGPGKEVLDLACGSGLALELAVARGASGSGIDASGRLVAIARDRIPDADIRVGDLNELPWDDASFDVVTSFRGIWGTTPDAVSEAWRVLRPGGRIGLTVWGHIKASTGAWALQPFALAAPEKVAGQARMVALGRPGAGEEMLSKAGFVRVRRHEIPFVWEFADPAAYARALASTGHAEELAHDRVREGLPLRAQISVVGYTAKVPFQEIPGSRFLSDMDGEGVQGFFESDLAELGYVMNATRLWARDTEANEGLFDLLAHVSDNGRLSYRDRAVLVAATTSTCGDASCSLAWGSRLATLVGADEAAVVISGVPALQDPRDEALASWARSVTSAGNPHDARAGDRTASSRHRRDQVFAATVFIALRLAFATVNDALGATPDDELRAAAPDAVRRAVTDRFG
jgi:SAM-dependent methyltransferase